MRPSAGGGGGPLEGPATSLALAAPAPGPQYILLPWLKTSALSAGGCGQFLEAASLVTGLPSEGTTFNRALCAAFGGRQFVL